jgi:hypothetical protein
MTTLIATLIALLGLTPGFGDSGISQLQQWKSTSTPYVAITTQVFGSRIYTPTSHATTSSIAANVFCLIGDSCRTTWPSGSASGFSTTSADYWITAYDKGFFFSTTSANAWKTVNNFFSTTSASYFSSAGLAFSTTSTDYWKTQNSFFSTTSASAFAALGLAHSTTSTAYQVSLYDKGFFFSTTSTDYWKTQNNFFSTTSASHFSSVGLAFSTTSALAHLTLIDKGFFFSTTSALAHLTTIDKGFFFSTTSDNYNLSTKGYITGIAWGAITGTLSNQSDLNAALYGKIGTSSIIVANEFLQVTAANTVKSAATSTFFNNASASVSGLLTSGDWTTFNAKESALTFNYPLTRSTNTISSAATSTLYANLFGNILFVNSSGTTVGTSTLGLDRIPSCATITGGSGLCDGVDDTGAGGGAWPFTPATSYNVGVSSTSTPLALTAGVFASSTSHFVNADFSGLISTYATTTYASSTALSVSGTGYFGTASTSNLTVSGVQSALHLASATGVVSAFGGSSCGANTKADSISATGVLTCTSVANAALANSSLTITAGTGMGGGGAVSLGGSVTLYQSSAISTSTGETRSYVPYWATTNGTPATLASAATSSLSAGTGISISNAALAFVIGSQPSFSVDQAFTPTWTGLHIFNTSGIIANASSTFTGSVFTSTFNRIGLASSTPSALWGISIGTTTMMQNAQFAVGTASSTTSSANETVNWDKGNTQRYILNTNTNFTINSTSSYPRDGAWYALNLCQDPTGSRTATFVTGNTHIRWKDNATTTISATANKCTYILFNYDATYTIYRAVASSTPISIQ